MSDQPFDPGILLLSDPRVAAIPITETGERLLDVREAGLRLDERKRDETGTYARLRSGVVERLLVAERRLPPGLALLLIEGHRPAWLQREYFEEHLADLRGLHPDWSADRLRVEASKYISPLGVAPGIPELCRQAGAGRDGASSFERTDSALAACSPAAAHAGRVAAQGWVTGRVGRPHTIRLLVSSGLVNQGGGGAAGRWGWC